MLHFLQLAVTVYYIDYECNAYMMEWDFEHWGAQYWTAQVPLVSAAHIE